MRVLALTGVGTDRALDAGSGPRPLVREENSGPLGPWLQCPVFFTKHFSY